MMNTLPVFLKLETRSCLVVGGGDVAARKVAMLLRAGGNVTVVAAQCNDTLQRLHDQGEITLLCRDFVEEDVQSHWLVVAATDNADVNRLVYRVCDSHNIPVNVVDEPALCSFIFPSIVDRSPVIIAVSTGGASPLLARLLRSRLETLIPHGFGRLAALLAGFRQRVRQQFTDGRQRRRFWEGILQGPVSELVFSGREADAARLIESGLDNSESVDLQRGDVALVGAGPGDPDLLTFRALRLLQQADVILYDRLVAPAIVDLGRRDAERVYVGKKRDYHSIRQEEISQLMARLALQGKHVVRLKGGDPFIFGRGGEEISEMARQGIPFQIVPGITAATGCASYAGIPLTHRDHAQSVVFVTGHLKDDTVNLNWQGVIQPQQTIVIYMGLHGLDMLCRELVAHGMPASTPVALVEQGTTARQRVFTGDLVSLPAKIAQQEVHAPTLLIVGDVVRLHDELAWYQPLSGEPL